VESRREEYIRQHEQMMKSGKKRRWSEEMVDTRSLPSVAQQMVHDFMGRYAFKVGLPRVVGRKKWVTDANLGMRSSASTCARSNGRNRGGLKST
jgi:hypothetical protein